MLETRTELAPKLRSDLIISRQIISDQPVYVVKEPVSERFFRFREIEGYILNHLDGKMDVGELRKKVEAEFNAALPRSTLDGFIAKLAKLNLLAATAEVTAPAVQPRMGKVRGDVFYLRFKAFNPDALLSRLVRRLRFLFTPSFVVLSSLTILGAASLTAFNWEQIRLDLPRLYNASSLLLAYVVMLLVITAHEFAHGLTCKYYGGGVREMGFMLIYFQPAFYCNVSDAWLFPKKSHRLWVTFAGAFFEIFIWAIATIVWRITDPYTVLNYMALVVMATSGIRTLFNLNPLVKLDGYYLLGDLVGVQNLRHRAFAYLGNGIRRVIGLQRIQSGTATPREKRVFLIYGILAASYSIWLFVLVATALGGFLTRKYRGWGFVLFTLLLVSIFRSPLKKLLKALPHPALNTVMRAKTARWIRLAVLAGVLVALSFLRMELRIGGEFTVLPVQNADVRAAVDGIISKVYADEGDSISKGAAVVSLSERDFQAELHKLKAQTDEAEAKLKLLKAGSRPEEIELARTLVAKAEERVQYAAERLDIDEKLSAQKVLSQREFEDTREQNALRKKELQEAKDHLSVLLAGSRPEDIEATEAEIRRLQAQQRYLEEQMSFLKVTSPIDGIVVTHKLKDRLGEAVHKGDLIAKVHELKTVSVEIAVPESEIADVKIGQPVVVKARAYPDRSFRGTVTIIAPVVTKPDAAHAERVVLVTTRFDNPDLLLKPDMTGNAKISCGQRRIGQLVARRFLRFIKVEFWSWW